MQSLMTLISILLPLFGGFFVPLPAAYVAWVNRLLNVLVYVILALIGLSLAQVENLGAQIGYIARITLLLFVCVISLNLLALMWFDRRHPWQRRLQPQQGGGHISLAGSLQQIACVVAGFALGAIMPAHWLPPPATGNYTLMLLVFLVGIQLRSSGITLRRVLLNRRGVQTAVGFILSCLAAGVLFTLIMPGVSLSQGLALTAGYGWYSLSGIVMTSAYGPVWGSIALVNDLAREFFALVFIPLIMRRHPSAAVGVGGATSLDFTLPVIQSSGGIEAVPLAISFGFIVNVVSPFLMVTFSTVHF